MCAHAQTSDRNTPAPPTPKAQIDILEARKDKDNATGRIVSKSALFAPYLHDYLDSNDTMDKRSINNPATSRLNSYHGSAVYVSSLLSPSIFHVYLTVLFLPQSTSWSAGRTRARARLSFKCWSNPDQRSEGFITWQVVAVARTRDQIGVRG